MPVKIKKEFLINMGIFKNISDVLMPEEDSMEEYEEESIPTKEVKINKKTVKIYSPSSYEECRDIGGEIKKGYVAVVNTKVLDAHPGLTQRLVDFLCGVCFSIEGHYRKLDDSLFLFTPSDFALIEPSTR